MDEVVFILRWLVALQYRQRDRTGRLRALIAQTKQGTAPTRGPLSEEEGGRERKRRVQATRSQAQSAKRARNCSTISACRWQTRDSLTPNTAPMAAMVSFS